MGRMPMVRFAAGIVDELQMGGVKITGMDGGVAGMEGSKNAPAAGNGWLFGLFSKWGIALMLGKVERIAMGIAIGKIMALNSLF